MARARNIKPGFFKNETLVELPFEHRLLFVGLWTLADKSGRLEDRAKRIKMELFPADNVDVEAGMALLEQHGFIQRYEVNGMALVQILNFSKHQSPHHTEKNSELPDPNGELTVKEPEKEVKPPKQLRGNPPDSLIHGFTDSLNPENNPPNPLEGGDPVESENPDSTAKPKSKREGKPPVQLKTFLDHCQKTGEKPISEYGPLLTYVEDSRLPMEYVQLCWDVFKRDFLQTNPGRKQADWRRHFLNYVTKRYYKLWYVKDDGTFDLTSTGRQEKMVFENRRAA